MKNIYVPWELGLATAKGIFVNLKKSELQALLINLNEGAIERAGEDAFQAMMGDMLAGFDGASATTQSLYEGDDLNNGDWAMVFIKAPDAEIVLGNVKIRSAQDFFMTDFMGPEITLGDKYLYWPEKDKLSKALGLPSLDDLANLYAPMPKQEFAGQLVRWGSHDISLYIQKILLRGYTPDSPYFH